MLTDELKKQAITSGNITQHFTKWSSIRRWLLSWEVYIIILIAAILRLYRLDTSEFSGDQTFLFRMAYDAVHFGLIPATSNYSSIGTANAPIAVNFLTIPVLFSSDPLWSTAMTALCNCPNHHRFQSLYLAASPDSSFRRTLFVCPLLGCCRAAQRLVLPRHFPARSDVPTARNHYFIGSATPRCYAVSAENNTDARYCFRLYLIVGDLCSISGMGS